MYLSFFRIAFLDVLEMSQVDRRTHFLGTNQENDTPLLYKLELNEERILKNLANGYEQPSRCFLLFTLG